MKRGQSLVELLVALAVGAILFIGTGALIAPSLQINKVTTQAQNGATLGNELMENVRVWSEGDWHNLLNLATGTANRYYLITSSSPFTATSGTESILVSTTTFTRFFYLSDAFRDSSGNVTSTISGNTYDPSTKQVTVSYTWTRGATTTMSAYLTRNQTSIFDQTDWSGGSGQNGPVTSTNAAFASSTGINYNGTAGSLLATIVVSGNGYGYYRSITVTSTGSVASGTNSNFPMLVSSTLSSWRSVSNGGDIQHLCTSPSGVQEPCDLVFATSSANCGATPLNFETEHYVSSTGELEAWVNVPTMTAGTVIYACYDASTVTTDQSHPSSTWDSNYVLVDHLNDTGPSATIHDSTSHGNNGSSTAGMAAGTGMIGGGARYPVSNTNDNIDIPDNSSLEFNSSPYTLSLWFNIPSPGSPNAMAVFGKNYYVAYESGFGYNPYYNDITFSDGAANTYETYPTAYNAGTWHYVALSVVASTTYMYIDGNLFNSYVDGGTPYYWSLVRDVIIGGDGGTFTGPILNGTTDEARVSTTGRSASWILTEYNNQSSPSTFYAMGTETALSNGVTSGVISSSTGQHWAWNDAIGWIDFYNSNNVGVSSTGLSGYASSSIGDISLDCATSRAGNVCNNGGGGGAQVAFSTNVTASGNGTSTGAMNLTVSGSNPVIVIHTGSHTAGYSVTSVSWSQGGGTPYQVVTSTEVTTSNNANMDDWCIPAPAGGAGTVTVNFSASLFYQVDAELFTGADQANPCPIGDATSSQQMNPITLTPTNLTSYDVSSMGAVDYSGDISGNVSNNSIYHSISTMDMGTGYSTSTAATSQSFTSVNGGLANAIRIKASADSNSTSYQILNDGAGDLSGWAWNDSIGWISFCGGQSTSTCPGSRNYQVTIDSGGNFQGWAWNDQVGWIDFNCDNDTGSGGICGTSNFEVKTTWTPPAASSTAGSLDSTTFDTSVASGAQLNSIMWQGTPVSSSTVQFQLAVSNSSSGPWSYAGSDGTSNTYYTPSGAGNAINLSYSTFNNYRYFRYRIFITPASGQSSQVNDVIVNWSP